MTVTCKLPESLDAQLEEAADERGVPKSELIREALRQYLPTQKKTKAKRKPSVHDRWRKFCGIVDSGVTDLATNPKYLNDFGK